MQIMQLGFEEVADAIEQLGAGVRSIDLGETRLHISADGAQPVVIAHSMSGRAARIIY